MVPVHDVLPFLFVVTEVESIDSLNVTEILIPALELQSSQAAWPLWIIKPLWLSAGDVEETVGPIKSTSNVFTLNGLLAFPAGSVTVMVQSE